MLQKEREEGIRDEGDDMCTQIWLPAGETWELPCCDPFIWLEDTAIRRQAIVDWSVDQPSYVNYHLMYYQTLILLSIKSEPSSRNVENVTVFST